MLRLSSMLFVLLLLAADGFIVATTGQLGDRVATHFDHGNLANGWMSRDGYLLFTLTFSTVLPAFVVATVGWLPRIAARSVNIPNRDYWLSPVRRAATLDSIAARAFLLGSLLAVFIAGIHALILKANATLPAQLPARLFWMLLIAFLALFLTWIGAFWWRFRNLPR
jgi:hypothetical protein